MIPGKKIINDKGYGVVVDGNGYIIYSVVGKESDENRRC